MIGKHVLLAAVLLPLAVSAAAWKDSSSGITYTYTLDNGEATITDCKELIGVCPRFSHHAR